MKNVSPISRCVHLSKMVDEVNAFTHAGWAISTQLEDKLTFYIYSSPSFIMIIVVFLFLFCCCCCLFFSSPKFWHGFVLRSDQSHSGFSVACLFSLFFFFLPEHCQSDTTLKIFLNKTILTTHTPRRFAIITAFFSSSSSVFNYTFQCYTLFFFLFFFFFNWSFFLFFLSFFLFPPSFSSTL